jgi:acetyltransferase
MQSYPADLVERWEAGGERLIVRPIRAEDAPAHDAFFHRLSAEDVRHRFFVAVRELTAAQLARFTQLDYRQEMAFIAVRESNGETVAVARLARLDEDGTVGEFAVVVQAELRGRGLAAHLMQRLIEWAPQHGLHELKGEILAENRPMLELARRLGFRLQHSAGGAGMIEAWMRLAEADAGAGVTLTPFAARTDLSRKRERLS